MDDQAKIERLLEVSRLLTSPFGQSIEQIAEKLEISTRTAYRYIESFKRAGFLIESINGYFKFIENKKTDFSFADLIHISQEEFELINDVINYFDDEQGNPELFKKLKYLFNNNISSYKIINKRKSGVITEIRSAIEEKAQIILSKYRSSSSLNTRDRLVEPIRIVEELNYAWCFEISSLTNKLFKIQRIRKVIKTSNSFQYLHLHKSYNIDDFRISGEEKIEVSFRMNQRAYNLIIEEYPRTKTSISKTDNGFIYRNHVCSFLGIGRFLLSMIGEVEVIQPQTLNDFLKNKLKIGFN